MTSSERARARALFMALALTSIGDAIVHAPSAFAQSAGDLETARALNKEGKELRAAGKLREALVKFTAAHDLGRTPVTGIELARTHVLLNQLVEAREVCLGIARMPVASDETERSASARAEAQTLAEELKPRIPSVLVRLSGVPIGKKPTVLIDRVAVPSAAAGEPHKVNPGRHEIAAKNEGGVEVSALVDVKEAETKEVALTLPPEPAVIAPPAASSSSPIGAPPSAPSEPRKNKLATAGFTIAGAGFVLGSLSGLLAYSKKSNLDALCKNDKQCPPEAYDDLDAAKTWATFSTIAFGVGAVGAVIGIYAIATHKDDATPPQAGVFVGPGSVGAYGSF